MIIAKIAAGSYGWGNRVFFARSLLPYHLATFSFAIGGFIWGDIPAAGGQ